MAGRASLLNREKQKSDFEMPFGKVAHYDDGRGFGFIKPEDGGNDVFVHANYLVNADFLRKGQRVSFEVVNDASRGKVRADSVRVIDGAALGAGRFDAIGIDNHFLISTD
jgi:cold shock protein